MPYIDKRRQARKSVDKNYEWTSQWEQCFKGNEKTIRWSPWQRQQW